MPKRLASRLLVRAQRHKSLVCSGLRRCVCDACPRASGPICLLARQDVVFAASLRAAVGINDAVAGGQEDARGAKL